MALALAPSIKIRVVAVPSNTPGHRDHYVEVHKSLGPGLAGPTGTVYVTCGCMGGRNYWANLQRGVRTQGCYAMVGVRNLLEVTTPRNVRGEYRRFVGR
jgi:hypothetical protein